MVRHLPDLLCAVQYSTPGSTCGSLTSGPGRSDTVVSCYSLSPPVPSGTSHLRVQSLVEVTDASRNSHRRTVEGSLLLRSQLHSDTLSTLDQQWQRSGHHLTGLVDALNTGYDHFSLPSNCYHVSQAVIEIVSDAVKQRADREEEDR